MSWQFWNKKKNSVKRHELDCPVHGMVHTTEFVHKGTLVMHGICFQCFAEAVIELTDNHTRRNHPALRNDG